MNIPANESGICSCPLCQTATRCDTGYFDRPFADPDIFAGTSEAISETLGFCPRHGASLLSHTPLSGGVVEVIHDAIPRLRLLLNEKYLQKHQVQQILFGTDGACPACAYANRALGRQAASLARHAGKAGDGVAEVNTLCVEHFQVYAANLALEPRLAALVSYAGQLERVTREIEALLGAARETGVWPQDAAAATLDSARCLIAGRSAAETISTENALDDALTALPSLVEAIALPDVCPLCVEAERARRRWLHDVKKSAAFNQDAWLVFPACPEHVGAVARLGEPELTAAVVAHALELSLRNIHKQIHLANRAIKLLEEEARIRAEGPEVWLAYKRKKTYRKRPEQKTEGQVVTPAKMAKCPACERAEIAAEHATSKLLDLLHDKKYRDAYSRGYGLCLKHFARVYLVAHKGAVRTLLAEDMQRRLAGFAQELDELGNGLPESEMGTAQVASLITALRRFCNCR